MKLGLGTAQFGLDYGVSNRRGKCSCDEVRSILAAARGIRVIDTAAGYGSSEAAIGQCLPRKHEFNIITKTAQFGGRPIGEAEVAGLDLTFRRSLERLRQTSVYGLLVHSCDDLFAPGGERLMAAVRALKERGLVEKIGVSVYDAAQIESVMARFSIDLIQLPVNVLDQRLVNGGQLHSLAEAGVEVHARSVFLQGLLLMDPDMAPAHFEPVRPLLRHYHAAVAAAGMTPVEAALAFVKGVVEVSCVVVGVTIRDEFDEVVTAFAAAANTGVDFSRFAVTDERIVSPPLWGKAP